MQQETLKNCPFCGGDIKQVKRGWDSFTTHPKNDCVLSLLDIHDYEARNTRPIPTTEEARKFKLGERVKKIKGSSWHGRIVGFYSTNITPIGYAVESERECGSVQIYPEAALKAQTGE